MPKKKKSKAGKLHICYNAPVTLTFSLMATFVLLLDTYVIPGLTGAIFTATGKIGSAFPFNWKSILDYIRLFTHVLGHADWSHLIGNLSFVLLLGPLLEERYGSRMLLLMMTVTAFVTGVLNACFIPSGLLGASGIAFMMILLSSFTTITRNQIPLTFILIMVLYMGRELITCFQTDDISSVAHIAGGLCGSLFGFLTAHSPRQPRKAIRNTESPEPSTALPAAQAGITDSGKNRTATAVPVPQGKKRARRSAGSDDDTVVISSIKF